MVAVLVTLPAGRTGASPLFSGDSVLELTLTGSFASLFRESDSEGSLLFEYEAQGVTDQVMVRVRGRSRRRVCDFPPLRLDFEGRHAEYSVFAGQDEIKLVTHCRNHDRGEQDLLEEFLAYRILNVLTELSYRVRLLRLTYVDTGGRLPAKAMHRYGFLLESDPEFARRTDARRVKLAGVPKNRHDVDQAALIYVFEYMIGNTDWSLVQADYSDRCCHNVELVERDGQINFVPYDFDLAGLVNAAYAYPDPALRIKRVTQRLYRGVCTDREALQRAIADVSDKRERILALVGEVPGLSAASQTRARSYLQQFFDLADDRSRLIHSFERRCI